MICYKDKTFCPFYETCVHGDVCPSALNEEVKEGALKWWQWFTEDEDAVAPPIAEFTNHPKCYVPI